MLRRSALETVGLFDERIYMYMEETDLCRRLRSVGFEVYYVPSVEIVHRQWGSTFHIPERRTNELWRSRRYYWRKHHSPVGRFSHTSSTACATGWVLCSWPAHC